MYDLNAILARLRQGDTELSFAVRGLTDCCCRRLKTAIQGDDAMFDLWHREQVLLWGNGGTHEEQCMIKSLHTVYSIVIKCIAWNMICAARKGGTMASWDTVLSGEVFRTMGILNYCGEDWYCWILRHRNDETDKWLRQLTAALDKEDTIHSVEEFQRAFRSDSLKRLYETLIPEALRMTLGEYYTPDWLAACMIRNAVDAAGRPATRLRFLDPACGAGTFLTGVIRWLRKEGKSIPVWEDAVAGFDINPLAVLTARTNYLAMILDRLPEKVLIPVYQCDLLDLPVVKDAMLYIRLSIGFSCLLPLALCRRMVEERDYVPDHLIDQLRQTPGYDEVTSGLVCHDAFTARLVARLLIERIYAFFEREADVVIGNPPWINWENLSEGYRERSKNLWQEYGLYNGRGKNVRFLKDDISVLMTYIAIDRFLADRGVLSFALRQALFKSEKNGAMFRKFHLIQDNVPFRVLQVDDLGKIKPFAGVNIRAALVLIRKNEKTTFPVPYVCWTRKPGFLRATRTADVSAEVIDSVIDREQMLAFPTERQDPTSLWVSAPEKAMDVVGKVLGNNCYKGRTGVFTGGANAVYWLQILGRGNGDLLRITNLTGHARRKVETVERELEETYLYPLVQGKDLSLWQVQTDSYILCPHTAESRLWPVEEERLRQGAPETYGYLSEFRAELDARRGFAGWENEIRSQRFYSILRIGEYTFSKYKVAWRYIAQSFITAVIEEKEDEFLGRKLSIPNEKVMYVGTDNREEAYYLCGLLSSLPVSYCVRCYMNPTSISAHVLEKLRLPQYDAADQNHRAISALCEAGHKETDHRRVIQIRAKLDQAAAKVYGIDESSMEHIRSIMNKK